VNSLGAYLLRSMIVQNPEMLKDLNLPLCCQVLVSEKDNTALIDECSELIQLLVIQLT
jgi:hypothetical protein